MFKAIFAWLRRLWSKPKSDALPFTASQRDIFRFCDRGAQCKSRDGNLCRDGCRSVDPMRVLFALMEHPKGDLSVEMRVLGTPSPDAFAGEVCKSLKVIIDVACSVLNIKLYDDTTGRGLTFPQVQKVFFDFMTYIEAIQKKTSSLRKSPQPMASFPAAPSITKPSSGSGSTATESSPEHPPQQRPVLRSRLEAILGTASVAASPTHESPPTA